MHVGNMYVGVNILRTLVSFCLQHSLQQDICLLLSREPGGEQHAIELSQVELRSQSWEVGQDRQVGMERTGDLLCCQRVAFPALVHSKDFEEVRDPGGQPGDFSKGVPVDRQPLSMFPRQVDRQDLHTVSRHGTIWRGPHDGDFHVCHFHKL